MKTINGFAMIATAWVLLSCSEKEAKVRQISRPLPEIDAGKSTFVIDTSKDTLLELASGSTIMIPANSMTGPDGKPFDGKAEVVYEEYLDQAGIIISGIPMVYDSAGQEYCFQSAGMFQIDAKTTEGEQLAIRKGKTVTVSVASSIDDSEGAYNFYQFDTVAGNWNYIATKQAEPAAPEPVDSVSKEGSATVNTRKVKTVSDFVFDINADVRAFPELIGLKDVMWKYSGNRKFPDPEKEKWVFSRSWVSTVIKRDSLRNGEYIVTMSKGTEVFKTSVVPVSADGGELLVGENKALDESLVALDSASARLTAEYAVRRTIPIGNFGVYNWDFIKKFRNPKKIKVRFYADGTTLPEGFRVYEIFSNGNITFEAQKYNSEYNKVIAPEDEFSILAVNAEGKAYLSRSNAHLNAVSEEGETDLNLEKCQQEVKCYQDLLDVIIAL